MTNTLSPPPFRIRVCESDADRDAAMRVRFEVFVDEQNVPSDLERDEYDADALHLLAVHSETGEPLGTARIVGKELGIAKIGRVAVRKLFRGFGEHGVGYALMTEAMAQAKASGHTLAILDAQVPVISFYERLGFIAEGPVFDDAGIPHRRMTKGMRDAG